MKAAPLALCDVTAIDQEKDLRSIIEYQPEGTVENFRVVYSPKQRWFYLSDQQPSEQYIFLSGDTKGGSESMVVLHYSNGLANHK